MNTAHLNIVGPTASGKSALASTFARTRSDVELISVDAIAVYRGLDIGTAKPSPAERAEIHWHLLDLVECDEEFSVAEFQRAATEVVAGIESRRHAVIAVGGTGLYQRAIVDGLDLAGRYPQIAAGLEQQADVEGLEALYARLSALDPLGATRVERGNRRRIVRALEVTLGSGRPFSSFGAGLTRYPASAFGIVGIDVALPLLHRRIAERIEEQFAAGFLEEVRGLLESGRALSRTAAQSVGYKELLAHLAGECSLEAARDAILSRSRRLARRQLAWFRRDPRVHWLDGNAENLLEQLLKHLRDDRANEVAVSR